MSQSSMGKDNLLQMLGDAQTLQEAFERLCEAKGVELMVQERLELSYKVLSARREFVILEDQGGDKEQFLHKPGTTMGYYIR